MAKEGTLNQFATLPLINKDDPQLGSLTHQQVFQLMMSRLAIRHIKQELASIKARICVPVLGQGLGQRMAHELGRDEFPEGHCVPLDTTPYAISVVYSSKEANLWVENVLRQRYECSILIIYNSINIISSPHIEAISLDVEWEVGSATLPVAVLQIAIKNSVLIYKIDPQPVHSYGAFYLICY